MEPRSYASPALALGAMCLVALCLIVLTSDRQGSTQLVTGALKGLSLSLSSTKATKAIKGKKSDDDDDDDDDDDSTNDDDATSWSYTYSYTTMDDTPVAVFTSKYGNVTIASDVSGKVYRSTDFGDSWDSDSDACGGNIIYGAAMSDDGKEILAGTVSGGVYYSKNGGKIFKVASSGTPCSLIAASDDLAYAACIGGQVGDMTSIYYSTDRGITWTESSSRSYKWTGIVSNSDNSYIVTAVTYAYSYAWVSTDYGASFSVLSANELRTWACLSANSDLSRMILTDVNTLNTHITMDYGETWQQMYCGECTNRTFTQTRYTTCGVSRDGLSYAIGFQGEQLKVIHDCDPDDTGSYTCRSSWEDQLTITTDASSWDTQSVSLSGDGTYFFSADATTKVLSSGTLSE